MVRISTLVFLFILVSLLGLAIYAGIIGNWFAMAGWGLSAMFLAGFVFMLNAVTTPSW